MANTSQIRELSRKIPNTQKMQSSLDDLSDCKDREIAIIGGSVLDFSLTVLLLSKFNKIDDKDFFKLTFGERGVLDSIFAKLCIARHLGLLSSDLTKQISRINLVRNAFAHSIEIDNFAHDAIKFEIMKLDVVPIFCAQIDRLKPISDWWPGYPDTFFTILDSDYRLIADIFPTPEDQFRNYTELKTKKITAEDDPPKTRYIRSIKLCWGLILLDSFHQAKDPSHFDVIRRFMHQE